MPNPQEPEPTFFSPEPNTDGEWLGDAQLRHAPTATQDRSAVQNFTSQGAKGS